MELTGEQYQRIQDCLPRQHGNVSIDNLRLLNARLDVRENGCQCRAVPRDFGNWHPVYLRGSRWRKAGEAARPGFIWSPRLLGAS